MKIKINQNDSQLIKLNNSNLQDINISANNPQTLNIQNTTPQDIGINQSDNQVILISGGGAIIGITDVLVNGVSVVSGNIAYVIVPTKLSELQNDTHFITTETDPTVPTVVKQITLNDINSWNSKQDELVSGTNIKTINGNSILGNGNLVISGTQYTAGDGISIENDTITNTVTSYNALSDLPTIPTKTSDLINDNDFVEDGELAEVAFTGSYANLDNTPNIPIYTSDLTNDSGFIDNTVNNLTKYMLTTDINTALGNKQDTLVSGTNIKTINSNSVLGSGDISINVPTKTSDLTNDSGFITSTDYATSSTGGTVIVNGFGLAMASNGTLRGNTFTYANYGNTSNSSIITKGTLENVITGKSVAFNNIDNNFSTTQTINGHLNINNSNEEPKLNMNSETVLKFGTDGTAFLSANTNNIVLRPNGTASSSGQFIIGTNGIATMNGTQVATINDIPSVPDINFIKIYNCTDTVTVPANSTDSYTLRTLPSITDYTFIGILTNSNGYGDQWLVSYSSYGGNIVAMINSKFNSSLSNTLNYSLIYLRNDYYSANVTQI